MAEEYEIPYMVVMSRTDSIYWKRRNYERRESYGIDWFTYDEKGNRVEVEDLEEKRRLELIFQRNSKRM